MIYRTSEQIIQRIQELATQDLFGFQRSDLLDFLPFDAARPFLQPEATAVKWRYEPPTVEAVRTKMYHYMAFAWDKANNCRGLSAVRSVEHLKAWLWLLDETALADALDSMYEYYGKPCLQTVCDSFGWDWKQWDNGVWTNDETEAGVPPQPGAPFVLAHP